MDDNTVTTVAIISVIVAVCSLMANFILAGKQNKAATDRDQTKALWEKIDDLRGMIEETNDTLLKEYMTQDQIREFFKLSTDAWVVKLDHIDDQISDIKKLLEVSLKKD